MSLDLLKIAMPFVVGVLFVMSYFFSDKHFIFEFLAYFPRRRSNSIKAGSLIFGIVFILVAVYNIYLL